MTVLKSFPTLRDFLSPVWRYALSDRYTNSNAAFNRAVIRAIDNSLKSVSNKTVASRMDLYFKTARHEYLDYWGSWFGLERLNHKESDDHYRKRIIHHVEHSRATIPAMRTAIAKYLNDNYNDVHIFEPWQYAFLTNDYASRTNSLSHLYGYYYRPAIINIVVDKPFNDPGVIDYINWFRPVGVLYLITYDSGQYGDIWHMPQMKPLWEALKKTDYIGFDTEKHYNLNFVDENSEYGHNPFYVSGGQTLTLFDPKHKPNTYYQVLDDIEPLSDLNGTDVLIDKFYYNKKYYSYLATLHGLLKVNDNDNINSLLLHSYIINPDKYPDINKKHGLRINITHHSYMGNMLSHTMDLGGYWKYRNGVFLSGLSDKGRSAVCFTKCNSNSAKASQLIDNEGQFVNTNPNPYDEDVMPNLYSGERCYIGLDARAYKKGHYDKPYSENVRIKVQVNKNQSVLLGGTIYSNKWTHFSTSFNYDGSKLEPITFSWVKKGYYDYGVEVASPVLSTKSDIWQPAYSDLDIRQIIGNNRYMNNTGYAHISPNSEYVYGYLNIWSFYFHHVEPQWKVYNKLTSKKGVAPTSYQINKYIGKQFNKRKFALVYKPLINEVITTRLWIMNYDINSWVNYDTHNSVLGNKDDTYNLQFGDIAPLINRNGLLVFGLQLPAFKNDYKIELKYLGLRFEHFYPNEPSIQMFKPYPSIALWWDKTDYLFYDMLGDMGDNNEVGSFNDQSRGRAQRYYPIRYIRNWIRNVSYGEPYDKRFITNKSVLNGNKLLSAPHIHHYYPYISPWLDRPVLPSLTDYSNPVKSVSVLGAAVDDKYPTNRLNNLLKNSVFRYFEPKVWGHSKVTPADDKNKSLTNKNSVFMLKDINSEHVWFNNRGAKLWTTSETIGARNRYVLSFSAKSVGKYDKAFMVQVKLWSNLFNQKLNKEIVIGPTRRTYNLVFNTYGVYPDHVTFVWKYLGNIKPNPETFKDLKKYNNTFSEFNDDEIDFGTLSRHVVESNPNHSSSLLKQKRVHITKTVSRRPDNVYMPSEPAMVYWDSGNITKVPKPTGKNIDIDDGWNFNGMLPDNYSPAIFDYNGKSVFGYVPQDKVSPNKNQVCYVPDGHGDYALGYNLSKNFDFSGWDTAKLENVTNGKFQNVLVPKGFIYYTAPNINPANIEFRDIACRLLAKVYIDGKSDTDLGKQINHFAPQINYKGQDTLAYNDIIFGQPINEHDIGETFSDLQRFANDFSEFKNYDWTFAWLKDHIVLSDKYTWHWLEDSNLTWRQIRDKEYTWTPSFNVDDIPTNKINPWIPVEGYTFSQLNSDNGKTFKAAKNSNWLFNDKEPFDRNEHCVTVDLGRIYTNISHLLVHHGSASVRNVVYDSCLQTSIDGKHWHTWYDNYKGSRPNSRLDDDYVEPVNTPMSFPICNYDCLNSRFDYGKQFHNDRYVHYQMIHYPVKSLSSLLFDDDRELLPLYSQDYGVTAAKLAPDIPSLSDMEKYPLTVYQTNANKKGFNNGPSKLSQLNNSNWLDTDIYRSDNDVSSNYYWAYVHDIKSNSKPAKKGTQANLQTTLVQSLFALPSNRNLNYSAFKPVMKPKQIFKYSHVLFLNNPKTVLNGSALLQNGKGVPTVEHGKSITSGDIPNPHYSPYMYNAKLLRFDLRNVIENQFPELHSRLKEHGIKRARFFTQGMFAKCTTLSLVIKGQMTGSWYVSVWDNKKHAWGNTRYNPLNGVCNLKLTDFANQITNGYLYVLVLAKVRKMINHPIMNLQTVDLRMILNMQDVDRYKGGLYPHINYEYNDDTLYHVRPAANRIYLKMPWISKRLLGHKITVSFNMVSDRLGNHFQLRLGKLHTKPIKIDKAYQNFSFVFDVPNSLTKNKNITPVLVFDKSNAYTEVYGFKAELGVKQTPYVYPITV